MTSDLSRLRDLLVAAETKESDIARDQAKAEQDVEQVRQRAIRDQQRLDSGAFSSPKDLDNLQHEVASLARRQSDLEDIVLGMMERSEAAQERTTELRERLESVEVRSAEAAERRAAAVERIDSEQALVTKERAAVAASIPAELLHLYERLRGGQGAGVGAARLYQRRCEGCRLELGVTELNDIRDAAPDAVVRCENCQRILVRTPDSGL